jgi:putative transposase
MKARMYTPAFKLKTCQRIAAEQETQAQICRDQGLAHSVLERWYRAYRTHGENAFLRPAPREEDVLRRRLAEMERMCGQLAFENDLLKRAVKRSRSTSATP